MNDDESVLFSLIPIFLIALHFKLILVVILGFVLITLGPHGAVRRQAGSVAVA